jgi:hypothetical protein
MPIVVELSITRLAYGSSDSNHAVIRNVITGFLRPVTRSRQVCIYVVEALLIAIYLPEGNDVYIHIRPTSLPEATTVQLSLHS